MNILYLTDEPTIARNIIGSVIGDQHFQVSIEQNHVRVASDRFWFDLTKEDDTLTIVSIHLPPLVIKSYISMQRLKHFLETELALYVKRYYTITTKEENGVTTVHALKRVDYK